MVEALTPDGGFRNSLHLRARVVGPDFSAQEILSIRLHPDVMRVSFQLSGAGAYLVSVTDEGGEAAPSRDRSIRIRRSSESRGETRVCLHGSAKRRAVE
jgi:hypothetical protein